MNRIIITGRLTDQPQLRYTQSNKAFARFTLAVNRQRKQDGTQEADFINCIAWDKTAELVCNYLSKGSFIGVEGRLQTGTYEKADGSRGYTTDVYVQNIEFLEKKKSEQKTTNDEQENTTDIYADFGEQVDLDNFLD